MSNVADVPCVALASLPDTEALRGEVLSPQCEDFLGVYSLPGVDRIQEKFWDNGKVNGNYYLGFRVYRPP